MFGKCFSYQNVFIKFVVAFLTKISDIAWVVEHKYVELGRIRLFDHLEVP